jgi:hypothetical protein
MVRRIKFSRKGMQRKFLNRVLFIIGCPSLRSIRERGFDFNYSTLKNYFNEDRLLPEDFFRDLCFIGKIDINKLRFQVLDGNWGQIKGGKSSKR